MTIKDYIRNFIVLPLLAVIMLSSCGEMTEEIFLNEDGSGEYMIYTEMIGAMRDAMIQMDGMMTPDSIKNNETEEERFARIEEQIWKDFPEGKIDSILDFSNQMPDSIKETAWGEKFGDSFEGFMQGSREEGEVRSGMRFSFKSIAELNEFMNGISEMSKDNPQAQGFGMGSSEMAFEMSERTFSRKVKFPEESEIPDDQMAMYQMMLGDGKLKTIVHLPKRAKKISGENMIEKAGKTVVFEYDLLDYLKGKVNSDFEIKMKRR